MRDMLLIAEKKGQEGDKVRKMQIEKGKLIIQPHDFDHIMDYSDSKIPSEAFKEGLFDELFMNGLEDKKYDEIVLQIQLVEPGDVRENAVERR
jgi:hypothetical protein